MEYAKSECTVTQVTDTSIDCILSSIQHPEAGTQSVLIYTSKGLIPLSVAFAPTFEPLSVNSVSKITDINYLGGDTLVI